MIVLSYVKPDLFKAEKDVSFIRNKRSYFDLVVTSNPKRAMKLSKEYKYTLFILLTSKEYKKIPKNIFLYNKYDLFSNPFVFNNIKNLAINLRERYINKIIYKLKNELKYDKIENYFDKIGFTTLEFKNLDRFSSYIKMKNMSLKEKTIYLGDKIAGLFCSDGEKIYCFKYKIDKMSFFYKLYFNKVSAVIPYLNFLKTKERNNTNLKENEKFFASHIGEGFFIQNLDGKITFVNNILKKMLINYNINFSKLERLFIDNFVNSKIKRDRNFTFNFEVDNLIEGKHYFEINYSPVKTNNSVVSYCAIIRDISLQKKLEDALQISNNELERINKILKSIQNATILGFSKLAEYKDKETGGHLDRIQNYVRALTKEIYCREIFVDYRTKRNYITEDYIEELSFSSLLHDIGKMGIPDSILQKPTRLTPDEFVSMQMHTKIGGDTLKWLNDMVSEKTFLALAKEVAYYHHEKWNGRGYPFGLKEDQIPLSARIVGLCDVYDALTAKRSYKEPYSHEKACEIIYNLSGSQFDPAIITIFSSVQEEFRHIRNTFAD